MIESLAATTQRLSTATGVVAVLSQLLHPRSFEACVERRPHTLLAWLDRSPLTV